MMAMNGFSKLQSPNALDRFLSASKEQLTPAQYEEALAFFADITTAFMSWMIPATDSYTRALNACTQILTSFPQITASAEFREAYSIYGTRQQNALEELHAVVENNADIYALALGSDFAKEVAPISAEQRDFCHAQAMSEGQRALGDIPFVDDFGIVDDGLASVLAGVAPQKPQALATSASDDLIRALSPKTGMIMPLDGGANEFVAVLKRIPALLEVCNTTSADCAAADDRACFEVQQQVIKFFRGTESESNDLSIHMAKFPLFFEKALHMWEWLKEQQRATAAEVAVVKGQVLYFLRLELALNQFFGLMLTSAVDQIMFLHILHLLVEQKSHGGLSEIACQHKANAAKSRKVDRKKAMQSRTANLKRRK